MNGNNSSVHQQKTEWTYYMFIEWNNAEHKKEWRTDTPNITGGFQNQYVQWKNPVPEEEMLYDSISANFPRSQASLGG